MARFSLRTVAAAVGAASLTSAALIATAPLANAGRPTGCGGGTTTFTGSSYSGRAYVLNASVTPLNAACAPLGTFNANWADTGNLPSSGGEVPAQSLTLSNTSADLSVTAEAFTSSTVGSGNEAHSFATVAQLALSLGGVLDVKAGLLTSNSDVSCDPATGAYTVKGSSYIAFLTINGTTYGITGLPNQKITIPGLATIIIDEEAAGTNSIDVNALHIMLGGVLSPVLTADVVISHAHSDLTCTGSTNPPPPCQVKDFVTGGGWIVGNAGQKVTFGAHGGQKGDGTLFGHLNVVDHGSSGTHLNTGVVNNYTIDSPTQRTVYYDIATMTVQDNGETGTNDTFKVTSGNYTQSGTLAGGNIQIHTPKGCASGSSGGGKKGH